MTTTAQLTRAHAAAVANTHRGDAARWRACWAAAVVVGTRAQGQTRALATDLSRSVDTVEQMAQAAATYRDLHRAFRDVSGVAAELRRLRRCLSWSHFAAMGRLQRTHDLTHAAVLAELATAAQDGLSVQAMARGVEDAALSEDTEPARRAAYVRTLGQLVRVAERVRAAADRAGVVSFRITELCHTANALHQRAQQELTA